MRITFRNAVRLIAICVLLALGGLAYLATRLSQPAPGAATAGAIEIPRGAGVREIMSQLHERRVIESQYAAIAYVIYSGARADLKAGEYFFDRPMTIPEVIEKIVRGSVYLHRFTVPEGLSIAATARKWEEQGFGPAAAFVEAAENSTALIHDLDPKAPSIEGYLFPETYFFARGVAPQTAIQSMVARFRNALARLRSSRPQQSWPLDLRGTVILASMIETEAAVADERSIVSSVYVNRLRRKILLQCDPTVIYALERDKKYTGRLTRADLKYPSPYNTYVNQGLPPTAITNPGFAALEAATSPATTEFIFFVRGAGGRHVFSKTLAAHNRAVAEYRAMQRANAPRL